jgi:hypothetical protein
MRLVMRFDVKLVEVAALLGSKIVEDRLVPGAWRRA